MNMSMTWPANLSKIQGDVSLGLEAFPRTETVTAPPDPFPIGGVQHNTNKTASSIPPTPFCSTTLGLALI